MVKSRTLVLGIFMGLLLAGCASFAYKYYGLEGVSYDQGKLLGPKPKYDRSFSECAPTAQVKHPCVIMLVNDFKAFKQDYEDTKMRLNQCESGY